MATEEFAPAKINLTLHVTGRRADGYHLLDSLVVFADIGDRLTARPGEGLRLEVTGPGADAIPLGDDNLVLRAARLLAGAERGGPGAHMFLEKRLPAASGLGGGSADAAAALRLLARFWDRALPASTDLLRLGADVPVCLAGRPARMGGIGGRLTPAPPLPPVWLVLANPGIETPTPAIFAALRQPQNPAMPADLPHWRDAAELAAWLRGMRNDLEPPARSLVPAIDQVLDALGTLPGCLAARMSGSGATCFGLFADRLSAAVAARSLASRQPEWWVEQGAVLHEAPVAT